MVNAASNADLQALGAVTLQFLQTTHGEQLAHDHHCPAGKRDPEHCTCGWAFVEEVANLLEQQWPDDGQPVPVGASSALTSRLRWASQP